MVNFIQQTVDLGTILPNSKTVVVFPFDGDKQMLVDVIPSCGCTANCKILDGYIEAEFTESDDNVRKNVKDLETKFPSGLWPIHKTLTVYYDDGKDLKITNENGLVFNPEKKRETLTFMAKVKYKGE